VHGQGSLVWGRHTGLVGPPRARTPRGAAAAFPAARPGRRGWRPESARPPGRGAACVELAAGGCPAHTHTKTHQLQLGGGWGRADARA
jgi:hypothetical protein